MGIESSLDRWEKANLIDKQTVTKIIAYEKSKRGFRFSTSLLSLGALAILLGMAALIGANWNDIPAMVKILMHMLVNLALGAGVIYAIQNEKHSLREILLFLLAGFTMTLIALIGQIYQTGAPLWQAMTLWLAIISPFLFVLAESRKTITLWSLLFLAYCFLLYHPLSLVLSHEAILAVYTIIPFIMIGIGQCSYLREIWPKWSTSFSLFGSVFIALAVLLAQTAWSLKSANLHYSWVLYHPTIPADYFPALVTGLIASLLLFFLRSRRLLIDMNILFDVFVFVSVLAFFLPILIHHGELPVVGAITFMAYCALIAWTALNFDRRKLFGYAIMLIGLRLIIVYIELFGSLLLTGMGLIISGVLLILFVFSAKNLIKKLNELTRPA